MGWKTVVLVAGLLLVCARPIWGQFDNVSETLTINSESAISFMQNDSNVLSLTGPVRIEMDRAKLSADNAVVWVSPAPGGLLNEQSVQIVLLGNAELAIQDNHVTRSAPRLLVTRVVRGDIRLNARQKITRDDSQTQPVLEAAAIINGTETSSPEAASAQPIASTRPSDGPDQTTPVGVALAPHRGASNKKPGTITFRGDDVQSIFLSDGTEAFIITGGSVTNAGDDGSMLELRAQRIVVFTSVTRDDSSSMDAAGLSKKVEGAYLEGDVRIDSAAARAGTPEQRLTADRAYYNLKTDQAILTDVVLHSVDPITQIPIIVRAEKVRQLTQGEYNAEHVEMTTSNFAVPTYSINSSYAYIHQVPDATGKGSNFDFTSQDDSMRMYGVPLMYWPSLSGSINNDFPMREFNAGNTTQFGSYITTDWGLFETLGQPVPKDVDIDYRADYYSERGAGGGLNATYTGGFIDPDSRQSWSYQGDFTSYIISDHGVDDLGGARQLVTPPDQLRGRVEWEHQQFLPDDWQVQIRAGYASDPTFVEQYYQSDYDSQLPYDAEFYAKHQKDTEAITFSAAVDTTPFVTNSDRQQEMFDVERMPEVGYHRIGDSFLDDNLTFFSDDSASRLRFQDSRAPLSAYGYFPGVSPGIASEGVTGTTGEAIYREDARQEVDWPISIWQFKAVPYTMGRVTEYSDSTDGNPQTRLLGGVGMRLTTTFWAVDESIDSELLDLHRVRYVLQPELNVFTAGTSVDNDKLYDFDPNIDAATDVSAAQIALHQRWETQRGGPGHWRSVDVLDMNVEGNFFANQPPPEFLNPVGFRSIFLPSMPEASVARQGVNADATWHISDTTAFLADSEWNLDTHEEALASAGLAVSHDERLTYFVGDTYLQPAHSQIINGVIAYQLTSKYQAVVGQSFYFGDSHDIVSSFSLIRKFDTFSIGINVYHDAINNRSGFGFNLIPQGGRGINQSLTGY